MPETPIASRMLSIILFMLFTAVASHLFFGSIIFAAEQQKQFKVVLRDQFEDSVHYLSGIVMVPSVCHIASSYTKNINTITTAIIFETWERSYLVGCDKTPVPRIVKVTAFAPKDVNFVSSMNGEDIPLTVVFTK